ncbi:MAG TPA: M48 family metalloprotease [Vicinamibacterales bacterium]|nr:M48 family metalloprotease [Vicinamibacterales bacterium]
MGFDLRVIVVALSSFAMGSLAGSALVPWLWRRVQGGTPAARATALLRIRALPLAMATASLLLAVLSFLFFEPRRQDERMGLVLLSLAAVGIVFVTSAAFRLARLLRLTKRLEREWLASADPLTLDGLTVPTYAVSSTFPIVALIGFFRPRMVVARNVLAACSEPELRAIVAHEMGHFVRRDNLVRAILALSPDVLAWVPLSNRLALAWHDAAEEAADDHAAVLGEDGRLYLAEALLRVARLAPPGTSAMMMPASALYRGENIDQRVRRLLGPPAAAAVPLPAAWRALATTAIVASAALALHAIHELLEAAVTFLP